MSPLAPIGELALGDLGDLVPDLSLLRFRTETHPVGPAVAADAELADPSLRVRPAIDLVWELPDPAAPVDALSLLVVRRIRRFPGRSRRGVVVVEGTAADLAEGDVVYDSATVDWDLEETREDVTAGGRVLTTRQLLYRGSPRDRVLARTIRREYRTGEPGPVRTTVRFVDRDALEAGTIYYYTAFVGFTRRYSSRTQSSALATGPGGLRLFPLLPRVDQQRDAETPLPFTVENAEAGRGQLERLLRTAQAHSDMLLGFVEGLRDLHDPRRVDSRLLDAMAAQIGWRIKGYLNEEGQRNEIVFAPEVYRTLGTKPNIAAIVNRLTNWSADVREFARHIVLSWDGMRVETLDGGVQAYLDSSAGVDEGPPPALRTQAWPNGSVDTADAAAMFRLRNRSFADTTAYTYDCGIPDPLEGGYSRTDATWYNRETIGIYATPDVVTEPFALQQTWERVREILAEFLPIQVRPVLFVRPGLVVEDPYAATEEVQETLVSTGLLLQEELYGAGADAVVDRIPAWRWLISNDLASRAVDTAAAPVDLTRRTRHVGVEAGP